MNDSTAAQAATGQFSVAPRPGGDGALVAASGEIDLANADRFQAALTEAATGASALTVDMTRVGYCDSAAVRVLFALAQQCRLTVRIPVVGPLTTLFAISGLEEVAAIERLS